MKRALYLAAAAALTLSLPTLAQAQPWTGCYGGVIASYNALVQDGGGIGLEGPGAGGTIGCDITRGKLLFGGLAEYGFATLDAGGDDVDLEGWSAGVRAGVLVWDQTLVYGVAKWTDLDASTDGTPIELSLSGPGFGGGVETAIGGGFYIRGEYVYSMLEPDEALLSDEQVNTHSGRLGFIYKFGGPDVALPASLDRPLK